MLNSNWFVFSQNDNLFSNSIKYRWNSSPMHSSRHSKFGGGSDTCIIQSKIKINVIYQCSYLLSFTSSLACVPDTHPVGCGQLHHSQPSACHFSQTQENVSDYEWCRGHLGMQLIWQWLSLLWEFLETRARLQSPCLCHAGTQCPPLCTLREAILPQKRGRPKKGSVHSVLESPGDWVP